MATEDEDLNTGIDDSEEELDEKPEPAPELPADPNEPIEVVTDEAKKESRRQRRAERQNEFRRIQEENARLRAESDAYRRQPAYQPQQQQQPVNPAAQRLREIDETTQRLHREYEAVASRPGFTPQMQADYEQRALQLQTARMAAVAQATAPQINEQELYRKIAWQQFTNEHADVFGDEKAQNWAIGEWQKLVKGEGKADTKQLAEEILDRARVRFGMKPRNGGSSVTQADRQRLTGVGSRGAPGAPQQTGAVKMGPREKHMARLAFGDKMSEAEAYQKWANTVGKKLLEQQRKGG